MDILFCTIYGVYYTYYRLQFMFGPLQVLLPALQLAVTILSFTTLCRSCSNRTAWTKRELDLGQSSMAVFEDCQATAGWIGGR